MEKIKYAILKVRGFMNEAREYTGIKTTLHQLNRFIEGYAIMRDNKVIEVYTRKYVAEMALKALNAE
jgi:hypothetical protein